MAATYTLKLLRDERDLSPLIKRVLSTSSPQFGQSVIDIGAFLVATSWAGEEAHQQNSARAWADVAPPGRIGAKPSVLAPGENDDMPVSEGLAAAFATARDYRTRIGGRDRFIGLRHVLAAIVTSKPSSATFVEFTNYLNLTSLDLLVLVDAVERNVRQAPEPQESLEAWRHIFGTDAARPTAVASSKETPKSPAEPDTTAAPDALGKPPIAAEGAIPSEAPVDPPQTSESDGSSPSSSQAPDAVYAIAGADDPFCPDLVDRSGSSSEAEAFAMLAIAKDFRPPLAVGVFGEWGAGKSYFLRLIRDHVARLATSAASSQGSPFHSDVAPILFNAWHYAETNLWASLVEHIFSELDSWSLVPADQPSLLDNLATSRTLTFEAAQTLISSRRDRKDAEQRYALATAELAEVQSKATAKLSALATTVWDQLTKEVSEKKELELAAQRLGFSDALETIEGARSAVAALNRELHDGGVAFGPIWRMATSGIVVVASSGGLIVLPLLMAAASQWLLGGRAMAELVGVGIVTPLVAAAGLSRDMAQKAIAQLQRVKPLLEQAEAKLKVQRDQALGDTAAVLSQKVSAEQAAREVFEASVQRVAQASQNYVLGTGKARLLSFIREKVAAGAYGRHLGFIAAIRRDFESLSKLMDQLDTTTSEAEFAEARHRQAVETLLKSADDLLTSEDKAKLEATLTTPVIPGRPFRRIVLYIDDLDRCPPEKVVEVLQAIHLLLAFPLFVVFVAVDVRWLRQSLEKVYGSQLKGGGQADSSDYLEKIFQLPYWVRRFDATATDAMLQDRLAANLRPSPSMQPDQPIGLVSDPGEPGAQIGAIRGTARAAARVEPVDPAQLHVSDAEASFISRLAPALKVSPRRVVRFINTYVLIKAGLNPFDRAELESGGYAAVLSLLAIAVVDDKVARAVIEKLKRGHTDMTTLAAGIGEGGPQGSGQIALDQAIRAGAQLSALAKYAPLVERYSFCGPDSEIQ
jgi:hypothetical protein